MKEVFIVFAITTTIFLSSFFWVMHGLELSPFVKFITCFFACVFIGVPTAITYDLNKNK